MKSQYVISPLSGFVVPLLYLFRQKMFKSILKIILKLLYKFTCFTGRQKYFISAVGVFTVHIHVHVGGSSWSVCDLKLTDCFLTPCILYIFMPTCCSFNCFLAFQKQMREYLVRLIYCEMLGHDASIGYVEAIKFAQQPNILDKRVGKWLLGDFVFIVIT